MTTSSYNKFRARLSPPAIAFKTDSVKQALQDEAELLVGMNLDVGSQFLELIRALPTASFERIRDNLI